MVELLCPIALPELLLLPAPVTLVLLLLLMALPLPGIGAVALPLIELVKELLMVLLLLVEIVLLLLLPVRKLPAVEVFVTTAEVDELVEFGSPVAVAEVLPDDTEDLPDAFDLRCFDEDETVFPPLDKLEELAAKVLLVILMLVADVDAEFMVESISFSGDEHESEEVSCCTGL